jgi:hypothetical protein
MDANLSMRISEGQHAMLVGTRMLSNLPIKGKGVESEKAHLKT